MFGLTVRWSLEAAPAGTLDRLRAYVRDESFDRFATLDGLRFKTWRARDGEWFEGTYVFSSAEDRQRFQVGFEAAAATAPGSVIVGSAPVLVEPFTVVAVAEGPAGFMASNSAEG
ncbi:hypothetical protein HMPREF0063_11825 [Aeromicrobium marinum DSM 15272]|uniref:ABM domain-containing protein n=1 Tax=Aeromicrobium marinum DSM 15272 TaxID=585531 RepID=E2SDN9_9ACTN|nr:hypothetical protein [Aeromicrobium marinum]EFQ82616.1 hypothetical protein HMPREF0063_11825 [Aeromicrobium marinum DSM 15272]